MVNADTETGRLQTFITFLSLVSKSSHSCFCSHRSDIFLGYVHPTREAGVGVEEET